MLRAMAATKRTSRTPAPSAPSRALAAGSRARRSPAPPRQQRPQRGRETLGDAEADDGSSGAGQVDELGDRGEREHAGEQQTGAQDTGGEAHWLPRRPPGWNLPGMLKAS